MPTADADRQVWSRRHGDASVWSIAPPSSLRSNVKLKPTSQRLRGTGTARAITPPQLYGSEAGRRCPVLYQVPHCYHWHGISRTERYSTELYHHAIRGVPALCTRTGTAKGVRGYGITVHHALISTFPTDRGLASRSLGCNHTCRAADSLESSRLLVGPAVHCALDNVIPRACALLGTGESSLCPWPCSSSPAPAGVHTYHMP
ncbi:hypothetical protein LXA43DRAFT_277517 [Ganoderma leucocontextum]|nr:hypothetical protein LXA43DRAFT_277517 [Ganoderma leucocontextum]